MAVNLNPSLPIDPRVGSVVNTKTGLKPLGDDKRLPELPDKTLTDVFNAPIVKSDEQTLLNLDADRRKQDEAKLDNPDRKTRQALNAYTDVANEQKRSEIQSLVGVDLFV